MLNSNINIAQNILKNAEIGTWVIEIDDGKAPRMIADETMLKLLGVTGDLSEEEVYNAWFDNIHPDHYGVVSEALEKMSAGLQTEVEYPWFLHGDKMYVRCGGIRNLSYKEGQRYEGYHRIINDLLHVQKQIQELNREKELGMARLRRYRDLVTAIGDSYESIYYVDIANDAFEIFKRNEYLASTYKDEKLSFTQSFTNYINRDVHEKDRKKMLKLIDREYIKKKIKRKNSFEFVYRDIHSGDVEFYEMQVIRPREYEKSGRIVIAFVNKTEVVKMENGQRLILEKALNDAESASRSKSTFLFNMSHDIRTPMNAVFGFTQMAQKHIDDKEKLKDCLDKITSSSEHLLSLVNDILDMSRIEAGKIIIEEKPVDLDRCRQELKSMVEVGANDKKVSLIFETDSKSVHRKVYLDVMRMHRVMVNVMNNAIKYSNENGVVRFVAKELKPTKNGYIRYRYSIIDEGVGMSEEFQKHLFEPFAREKSSTVSGVTGTGLGLAITKELVRLMKGTISVKSKLGKGTTVNIELEFREALDSQIEEKNRKCQYDESVLKGKRILLVEDNELNREIVVDLLSEIGIEVDEANDGVVAIEKCVAAKRRKMYDFILMDIQMPIMDGYKATTEIRNLLKDYKKHVPIIAMTANAFDGDKKRALDAGMDAHLAKPIIIEKLVEQLIKLTF